MEQMSLAHTGFELVTKRALTRKFLDGMNLVISWTDLLALIAPHAPAGKTGCPPFATEPMLRIHLLQQFFGHSDPAIEEALHYIPLYREFAHLDEEVVFTDSGYLGAHKRERVMTQHPDMDWQIAMMPCQRKAMDQSKPVNALKEQLEKLKANIRAKVEHPFRVIKCQFGHRKVRYRGLANNTSQLLVMFALSNLWMLRKRIVQGLQA